MLENPQATKDALVQWIRDYFGENGPNCSAVVGISGEATAETGVSPGAKWYAQFS